MSQVRHRCDLEPTLDIEELPSHIWIAGISSLRWERRWSKPLRLHWNISLTFPKAE